MCDELWLEWRLIENVKIYKEHQRPWSPEWGGRFDDIIVPVSKEEADNADKHDSS